MSKKSIKKRLEELELKAAPEDIHIFVCERTDGYVDIPQPDGTIRTVTEDQFKAEGGIIVRLSDK